MFLECLLVKIFPGPGKKRVHGSARVWTDHHFSKWSRGDGLQNNSQTYPDWQHGPWSTEISISQLVWSSLYYLYFLLIGLGSKNLMLWFYLSQPWKTAYSVALPVCLMQEISCRSLRLGYVQKMENVGSRQAQIASDKNRKMFSQVILLLERKTKTSVTCKTSLKHVVADVIGYKSNKGTWNRNTRD